LNACPVRLVVKDTGLSTRRSRVRLPYGTPDRSPRRTCASRAEIGRNDRAAPEPVTGRFTWGCSSDGKSACFASRGSSVRNRPSPPVPPGVWQRGRLRLPVKQFPKDTVVRIHQRPPLIDTAPERPSGLACSVNSVARVPACLAGSRGFDSRTGRQITAAVVQQVERRVEGPSVGGSIPSCGTK
jgi:hypothetical protein